jgi:hypothetical protein
MRKPLRILSAAPALLALLVSTSAAGAAILPDTIGDWMKGPGAPAPVAQVKVWKEYGLQDSETAPYEANGRKYTISAWRFDDATGSLAAFYETRPDDGKTIQVTGLGVANASDEVVAVGNYLFLFKGYKPTDVELNHVVGTAPHYAQSPLPTLPRYMPKGPEPNSERYITGPESLAQFAPAIPPSTAGFHFNAEGQLAKYGSKGHETTLLVFSYPTMEMARDRQPEFEKVAGTLVKRSGPLVAIALNPASPLDSAWRDDAERLLSQVHFQAEVTVAEHVPTAKDNPGNLFWNIFILCAILASFCVVSGLVVGGLRIMFRRAGDSGEGDDMISLHLSGRP